MKRVLSLALAALLLGSTAAAAQGWGGHHYSHSGYHGWSHHGYHGNNDAVAAVGLGIFALGALAIISSQQNAPRYDAPAYDDRYGPPPGAYDNGPRDYRDNAPPPPPDGQDNYGDEN